MCCCGANYTQDFVFNLHIFFCSAKKEEPSPEQSVQRQVDDLFMASPIGQTKFIPQIKEDILGDMAENFPELPKEEKGKLLKAKLHDEWINQARENLPWPAFDEKIKKKFNQYFELTMEWIERINFPFRALNFQHCGAKNVYFDPVSNLLHKNQAQHLLTMATFLAQRTDDPKRGVGAIIVSPEMEVLSLGWNGFPKKALYGEFPRGSKDDEMAKKKYPYVIHAEQNALLMRNKKNIQGSILFMTRTPCNECTPLIKNEGVKTVVVDDEVMERYKKGKPNQISYNAFPKIIDREQITCYYRKNGQQNNGSEKNKSFKKIAILIAPLMIFVHCFFKKVR